MKLAFVCVGNAGQSQMATAFAERERDEREMDVEIVTGGVEPADRVHDEVIEVMEEEGIDISDRTPREITPTDVEDVDYVVTMGCSVEQFRPDDWDGEARQWELEESADGTLSSYRAVRDEIRGQVQSSYRYRNALLCNALLPTRTPFGLLLKEGDSTLSVLVERQESPASC